MNPISMNKVFYHPEHIHNILNSGYPFPLHFVLGLTNRCNHRCQWCSVYGYSEDEKIDIEHGLLLKTLKEAKKLGLKAVTYIGQGEPLVYNKFETLVPEVAGLGIEQACFTNGGLLDRHFNVIMDSFLWFRVSLDAADQEQHNILHGVKDDFTRIMRTLSNMVNSRNGKRFPTIGVQYGLHQDSAKKLFKSACLAKEVGVDYFAIKPIYNRGRVGIGIKENILKIKDIRKEVLRTQALAENGFKVFHKPYQFELMDNPEVFTRRYKKCYGPHFEWHIFENGDVTICGPMRLKIGNIHEKGLEEMWRSREYREMVSNINVEKCYKGCRVHPLNELLWELENPNRENHINFI